MSKTSKAYRAAAAKVDRTNLYTPLQAAKLAKETFVDQAGRDRRGGDPAWRRPA